MKPSELCRERLSERETSRPGLGADDQVDVGNFVAFADQRLTDVEFPGHNCLRIRFVEEGENLAPHDWLDVGEG